MSQGGPIYPGAIIGVLGSGQLGRMFALAARRMGYRIHTFSPDKDSPTGQVADLEVSGAYEDLDAVKAFARGVRVITFEFENIPASTIDAAAEFVPVRPGRNVLHTTQHRLREKMYLSRTGFPVTPSREVNNEEELRESLGILGYPAVLKTADFGYDGKGQVKINSEKDIPNALATIAGQRSILEAFVDFSREISVVAARGIDGSFAYYEPITNTHVNHILDISVVPSNIPTEIVDKAIEITHDVLTSMNVVGVMCVEFFLTQEGKLLINELAPRPHNSGHFSIDACATSQFEQQLRAICGLPLGSTELWRPAAMANLLGDLWENGEPDWGAASSFSDVKLHLYGKSVPKAGRKMGHLTALASDGPTAERKVKQARAALTHFKDLNLKRK